MVADQPPQDRLGPGREQLRLLLAALPDAAVWPPGAEETGEVDHVYRRDVVLVRDADGDRVQRVLGGRFDDEDEQGREQVPDVPGRPGSSRDRVPRRVLRVPGHRRLRLDRDLPDALDRIDSTFGPGVATPDHVLWVTPRFFCPAVEPMVPPAGAPGSAPAVPAEGGRSPAGRGVRVSVVDTGWWPGAAADNPWLAGVTGDEEVITAADGTLRPYAGHGTFAAGVVRSVAPGCELRVEGLLPAAGAWYESDLVRELTEALRWVPDVISLQAGTTTRADLPLLAFEAFADRLRSRKGTVLLASAGNDGGVRPFWPAAAPWATAVGALTADGSRRAAYSNHGPWVDVYAVGDDHVNAFLHGTYVTVEPQTPAGQVREFTGRAVWSGTSFATPLVAGMLAERIGRTGAKAPRALAELLERAHASALPGVGPAALL